MIPVVSDARRDGLTSFHRLGRYLTQEKLPGSELLTERGPVMLSDTLLSFETAMIEMKATASLNPRVGDPILHFQLSWREGERPTVPEWQEAARSSISSLGFTEHQYMVVAHDDTDNFHIHLMVNRVHPETYDAHNPRLSLLSLHKTARELEHKFGWEQDHGLYRWDDTLDRAVRVSKDDLITIRQNAERPRGGEVVLRGKMERFNDQESVRSFAADKPARALKKLLGDSSVTWEQVHALLGRYGLEIHAAERGGYTVNVEGSAIKVKASDVFRFAFSGRDARTKTESLLGQYTPPISAVLLPPTIDYDAQRPQTRSPYAQRLPQSSAAATRQESPSQTLHNLRSLSSLPVVRAVEVDKMLLHRHQSPDLSVRRANEHLSVRRGSASQSRTDRKRGDGSLDVSAFNTSAQRKQEWKRKMEVTARERREARVRERQQERDELKREFHAVQAQHRSSLHQHTAYVTNLRTSLKTAYLRDKALIRRGPEPWVLKKAQLSQRTAAYVIAKQNLTFEIAAGRRTITRPTYQQWIEAKAEQGNKRAVAQLRGWRYQDKRNIRKQEAEAPTPRNQPAGKFAADPELKEGRIRRELDWEVLANERIRQLREEQTLPALASMKWRSDIKSGDVTYTLGGVAALVDRGKTITVLQHDQTATRVALEMAIHKYGRLIQATGSDVFQRQLIEAAVQNDIEVAFTDPQLQARFVGARHTHHKRHTAEKQRNPGPERDG